MSIATPEPARDDDPRSVPARRPHPSRQPEVDWEAELVAAWAAQIRFLRGRIRLSFEDAEDVAQDVRVKAYARRATYRPRRAAPIAFIMQITRTCALDHLRSATRRTDTVSLGEVALDVHEPGYARIEDLLALEAARSAAALSEAEDEVLCLHVAGFGDQEIADLMAIPKGTVASHLSRARAKLRRAIEQGPR